MLYIFDLDGTLVEAFGTQPLPGVAEQLAQLERQQHTLAVATNQAGPAWRAWTKQTHYPTPEALGRRFDHIAALLPVLQKCPWFAALYDQRVELTEKDYSALQQAFQSANQTLNLNLSSAPQWRKPHAGMLLAACAHYKVSPSEAIYVGDADTDEGAAQAAGMKYSYAEQFFGFKTAKK